MHQAVWIIQLYGWEVSHWEILLSEELIKSNPQKKKKFNKTSVTTYVMVYVCVCVPLTSQTAWGEIIYDGR